MKKIILSIASFLSIGFTIHAQVSTLQAPLCFPGVEENDPCVSANGRMIIYRSMAINDKSAQVIISTQKNSAWSKPEALPGANTEITTIANGGFFLSANGNQVYFHSARYGGVGGCDIWMIKRTTTGGWSAPVNFAKPLNSALHEVDPCVSPDGRYLFFVRLGNNKTTQGAVTGKIFMSERNGRDGWKEAKELPANINTGFELAPRLLADGKTMVFASARPGGKGGLDIYQSKWNDDGTWTTPVKMDFLNTPQDDRYVSIPAGGGLAYYSMKGKATSDLVRVPVPENFQPAKVFLYQGTLKDDTGKPMYGKVIVTAKVKKKSWIIYSADDGTFSVPLVKGDAYDIAIMSNENGYGYYSELVDATSLSAYGEKVFEVKLSKLTAGKKIVLSNLSYEENSEVYTWAAEQERNRLLNLMKFNPTLKLRISVYTDASFNNTWETDTIANIPVPADAGDCLVDTLSSTTDSLGVVKYKLKHTCVKSTLIKKAQDLQTYLVKNTIVASRLVTDRKSLYEVHAVPAGVVLDPTKKSAVIVEVIQ